VSDGLEIDDAAADEFAARALHTRIAKEYFDNRERTANNGLRFRYRLRKDARDKSIRHRVVGRDY